MLQSYLSIYMLCIYTQYMRILFLLFLVFVSTKANEHIKLKMFKRRPFDANTKRKLTSIPPSFTWTGYVNTPKAQGTCGGCFAFAAVGNLEYWYKKITGKLVPLSIQQALDCRPNDSST